MRAFHSQQSRLRDCYLNVNSEGLAGSVIAESVEYTTFLIWGLKKS